jgi:hypothetical protein
VHSECDVLVTENVGDFSPPSTGKNSISVERMSTFLNRQLDERPAQVISAMRQMVARHKDDPRTMPALIDTMVQQEALHDFARKLNTMVPAEDRGQHDALENAQQARAASAGMSPASDAVSESRSEGRGQRQPRSPGTSRDRAR